MLKKLKSKRYLKSICIGTGIVCIGLPSMQMYHDFESSIITMISISAAWALGFAQAELQRILKREMRSIMEGNEGTPCHVTPTDVDRVKQRPDRGSGE